MEYIYEKNQYILLPRLGTGPVKIQFADGSSCEIPASESVNQYFSIEDPQSTLRALEGKKMYIALAVVLTVMCSAGLVKYGVPYIATVSTLAAALPTLLLPMSYSRSFETESDDYAKAYFSKRNIDKKYLVSLFEKLGKLNEGDEESGYLSSHPIIAERIRNLQK